MFVLVIGWFCPEASGAIQLPSFLSSSMVLQHDEPVKNLLQTRTPLNVLEDTAAWEREGTSCACVCVRVCFIAPVAHLLGTHTYLGLRRARCPGVPPVSEVKKGLAWQYMGRVIWCSGARATLAVESFFYTDLRPMLMTSLHPKGL